MKLNIFAQTTHLLVVIVIALYRFHAWPAIRVSLYSDYFTLLYMGWIYDDLMLNWTNKYYALYLQMLQILQMNNAFIIWIFFKRSHLLRNSGYCCCYYYYVNKLLLTYQYTYKYIGSNRFASDIYVKYIIEK